MLSPCEILRRDPSAGFTFQRPADILRVRDQRLLAAVLKEPNDGLNFRRHRTFGKVSALSKILFRFGKRQLIEPFLFGPAKVDRNFFDGSRDQKKFRADFLRE